MQTESLLRSGWLTPCAFGLLLVAASSGCGGGNSPPRYHIAGNVTFAGKPVPVGAILFTPDGAKDKSSVAGYAMIKNGKYNTSAEGKGVSGGPQIVHITGFDGVSSELWPHGKPLVPEYVTKMDLSKEKTTLDFDVPAAHAR